MTTPATGRPTAYTPPAAAPHPAVHGRFLWYDLMTPDVDTSVRFYGPVTGWTSTPYPGAPEPAPYHLWQNGATGIGGAMVISPAMAAAGVRPLWMPYIGTRDVEASYGQALALGATSRAAPADIPNVGRFAVLDDPQGARFALFRPGSPETPGAYAPTAGQISWHELATSDAPAAFDFYAALFGWERTEAVDMGPHGIYQMYGQAGATYGGMFTPPGMPGGPLWLLYAHVPALGPALEAVQANGGTVLNGPMEVPGGDWVAQIADPHGAPFALHAKRV